jgi:hypothetical protein
VYPTSCDEPAGRRVGTAGRVDPQLEINIVDEDGQTVPS